MTDVASLLELTKGKIKSKLKTDLVEICKEHGLDESGTKDDLTERIWEMLETKRGEDEGEGEKILSDAEENEDAAMEDADVVEETSEVVVEEPAVLVEEEEDVVEEEEDDIIEEAEGTEEPSKMEEDEETEKAKLIDLPDTTENKAFLEEHPPATAEDDNNQTEEPAKMPSAKTEEARNQPNPNRLYFGNLAFDKVDNDVREIFKDCGEITDIHIIRDRYSRRSQGYGFITFADEESKEKALKLDGKDVFGRPLKVNLEARNRDSGGRGKAKTRIFIKNIPKEKTEEDVKGLFAKFGTIENFFFIKDHNTEISRGFGFMDFATPEEAQAAISMNNQEAFGGTLIVKIAEEKNSRGRGRGRGRDFGRGRGRGWGGQPFDPYGGFGGYGAGYGGWGGYGGYGGYGQNFGGYGGGYGAWGGYGAATGGYGAYPGK